VLLLDPIGWLPQLSRGKHGRDTEHLAHLLPIGRYADPPGPFIADAVVAGQTQKMPVWATGLLHLRANMLMNTAFAFAKGNLDIVHC
jgi:hypothetical protein